MPSRWLFGNRSSSNRPQGGDTVPRVHRVGFVLAALALFAPAAAGSRSSPTLSPTTAIFYYPWFGTPGRDGEYFHWEQNGHQPSGDLASAFYPMRGPSSRGGGEAARLTSGCPQSSLRRRRIRSRSRLTSSRTRAGASRALRSTSTTSARWGSATSSSTTRRTFPRRNGSRSPPRSRMSVCSCRRRERATQNRAGSTASTRTTRSPTARECSRACAQPRTSYESYDGAWGERGKAAERAYLNRTRLWTSRFNRQHFGRTAEDERG